MQEDFARLTPNWLNRAYVYNGSIGRMNHDFRYRLEQDGKEQIIHAATYSKICYEKADDVQKKDFPWNEEGVEELKQWLQSNYETFIAQDNAQ